MLISSQLIKDLGGRVIAPDDPEYDEARTVFYGDIDRRPAVIVRVADAAEVTRVIALASETGLELAVRSGGHSVAGHGVSEGGDLFGQALAACHARLREGTRSASAPGDPLSEGTARARARDLAARTATAASTATSTAPAVRPKPSRLTTIEERFQKPLLPSQRETFLRKTGAVRSKVSA